MHQLLSYIIDLSSNGWLWNAYKPKLRHFRRTPYICIQSDRVVMKANKVSRGSSCSSNSSSSSSSNSSSISTQ